MNKRGIELGINFIVTLILAIVVLSFGIYFVRMIYERSAEMKLTLDQQTEMELERLMDSGEKVSLYPARRTVDNGEMATFGLGVLNIDNILQFKVKISPSSYNGISGGTDWIQTSERSNDFTLNIANNEKKKILIGVVPAGDSGKTYVFNVDVLYGSGFSEKYDFTHKIYVEVS